MHHRSQSLPRPIVPYKDISGNAIQDGADEIGFEDDVIDPGSEGDEVDDTSLTDLPEFLECLRCEVKCYKEELQQHGAALSCKLCPFRKFKRKDQLVTHVERYHKEPHFTAAASQGRKRKDLAQHLLAKAIYRQRVVAATLQPEVLAANDLLARSSATIRDWNSSVSAPEKMVLEKENGQFYVEVWTKRGPQLWLRSQTAKAIRVTARTYITADFENLVIATALQSRGRANVIRDLLRARWAEDPEAVPTLLKSSSVRNALREVLHYIFTDPSRIVQRTIGSLKDRATARGEWISVTHDATFKCLFSLIGQEKMKQAEGELHAAHTFLGVTGCCPGFSPQAKEGAAGFERALKDIFTDAMRDQVRFLFSDSPNEAFLKDLPNALGIAEDFLHLVIRCEYCTKGRRIDCTREILELQAKFAIAVEGEIYRGQAGQGASWDDEEPAAEQGVEEWTEYLKRPWCSHREYVQQLKRVSIKYRGSMGGKDSKGKTIVDLLKSGSTQDHYLYQLNAGIFRNIAQDMDIQKGTMCNEAERRSPKCPSYCQLFQIPQCPSTPTYQSHQHTHNTPTASMPQPPKPPALTARGRASVSQALDPGHLQAARGQG